MVDTPTWIDESLRIRPEFTGTLVHRLRRVPGTFWMQPAHFEPIWLYAEPWRSGPIVHQWELDAKVEIDATKPGFRAESISWFNPRAIGELLTLVTDVSEKKLVHVAYRFNALVLSVQRTGPANVSVPTRGKIVVTFKLKTSGAPFIVPWSADVAEVVNFEHGQLDGLGWEGYYDWCMEHQWPERAAALAAVHQNSRPH